MSKNSSEKKIEILKKIKFTMLKNLKGFSKVKNVWKVWKNWKKKKKKSDKKKLKNDQFHLYILPIFNQSWKKETRRR